VFCNLELAKAAACCSEAAVCFSEAVVSFVSELPVPLCRELNSLQQNIVTFQLVDGLKIPLAGANYCRTLDNVRLNLANVRAKVILIGHWSDHKKNLSHTFFLL
jgi:hypothetical protein